MILPETTSQYVCKRRQRSLLAQNKVRIIASRQVESLDRSYTSAELQEVFKSINQCKNFYQTLELIHLFEER